MEETREKGEKTGFFERPGVIGKLKAAFAIVLAVLFVLDVVVHKHPYFRWEDLPGFYVFYGFISCVVIVAVSKLLGRIGLQRQEDYYDR